VGEVLNLKTF